MVELYRDGGVGKKPESRIEKAGGLIYKYLYILRVLDTHSCYIEWHYEWRNVGV